MSENLKPCAFCSSSDVSPEHLGFNTHLIVCNGCGADGPPADSEGDAVERWNRRHQEQETSSEFERLLAK